MLAEGLQPNGVYQKIGQLIDTDLSDLSPLRHVDPDDLVVPAVVSMFKPLEPMPERKNPETSLLSAERSKYKYHVMYSMAGGSVESRWVEEYFDLPFRRFLEEELGEHVEIFWDRYEISSNQSFSDTLLEGIRSSAAMIAFLTPRSLRSKSATQEMIQFVEERNSEAFLSIQLGKISSSEKPDMFRRVQSIDLSEYFITGEKSNSFQETEQGFQLNQRIREIAGVVGKLIKYAKLETDIN